MSQSVAIVVEWHAYQQILNKLVFYFLHSVCYAILVLLFLKKKLT